jgi:nitroreductase
MEFTEILRKRRMVRSFEARALDPAVVDRILAAGLRGPSAGFTQGVELLVLEGRDETGRYWEAALPADRRVGFPWPGLLLAPVLVLVLSSETAYRRRYDEADKGGAPSLAVPWWYVDAAFAALLLQLAAIDAGLGALFFAAHGVPGLRRAFGFPETFEPVGTVAIGHAAPDRLSSSVVARPSRGTAEVIHRGRW